MLRENNATKKSEDNIIVTTVTPSQSNIVNGMVIVMAVMASTAVISYSNSCQKTYTDNEIKTNNLGHEMNLPSCFEFNSIGLIIETSMMSYKLNFGGEICKNVISTAENKTIIQPQNSDVLLKEIDIMKNRLNNSIPIHTIVYLLVNSVLITASSMLLILRFIYKLYTIDPYYLICVLLIAMTLFFTALTSLKDWKAFLNERK